ncbi:MAG: DUF302 domain-containing protein [Halodesulfurarchaeum sp.]
MSSELPIDVESVGSEARGERRTTLEMDHDIAIEHVRNAFRDAGFGVATEFSASELLNEKVDAGRAPYHVLGACNPSVADRALDVSEERIGGLFPCNVVIWEDEPNRQVVYHVSIMKIARLVGMAPDDEEWEEIVAETGENVETAWNNL